MNGLRRTTLSAVLAGATALAGMALLPSVLPAAADPLRSAAAVTESPRLIVGYRQASSAARSDSAATDHLTRKRSTAKLQRRLATGAVLVDAGSGDIAALTSALRSDPDVAYVEPDQRMYAHAAPDDTEYNRQWHLFESAAGMNVPGAWATSTGSGVTVAVIDTGYVAHSDLAANIVAGYDFITSSSNARDGNGRDSNAADPGDWTTSDFECGIGGNPKHNSTWHGTHVAGTIAALTNNGKGVAGVAYNAKIQPVRVLGKCGGNTSDIADAIIWASGGTVSGVPANQTPAKVINMSLGGGGACGTTYQNAINSAVGRGTTVVVSAGNSSADTKDFQPASCANVINVAASDRGGDKAHYSNYGAKVDIAAPGGETRQPGETGTTTPQNGVWSTLNSGTTSPGSEVYKPYAGTSMAAPHIAGLVALILAEKSLSPAEVESTIKNNARSLPGNCAGGCGAGLADATKTLGAVAG